MIAAVVVNEVERRSVPTMHPRRGKYARSGGLARSLARNVLSLSLTPSLRAVVRRGASNATDFALIAEAEYAVALWMSAASGGYGLLSSPEAREVAEWVLSRWVALMCK
jgi:hypothetical protein